MADRKSIKQNTAGVPAVFYLFHCGQADDLIIIGTTHIDGQAHFHEEGAAFLIRYAVQCKSIRPVRRQARKAQVHLLF